MCNLHVRSKMSQDKVNNVRSVVKYVVKVLQRRAQENIHNGGFYS